MNNANLLYLGLGRMILCFTDFISVVWTYLQELGLVAGIPVGTSLIDAHAGGVGIMESVPEYHADTQGTSCI